MELWVFKCVICRKMSQAVGYLKNSLKNSLPRKNWFLLYILACLDFLNRTLKLSGGIFRSALMNFQSWATIVYLIANVRYTKQRPELCWYSSLLEFYYRQLELFSYIILNLIQKLLYVKKLHSTEIMLNSLSKIDDRKYWVGDYNQIHRFKAF